MKGWRHVRTAQEELGFGPPRYVREPMTVDLPEEWRREGMVVVVDSFTGELLGCMGRDTWADFVRGER